MRQTFFLATLMNMNTSKLKPTHILKKFRKFPWKAWRSMPLLRFTMQRESREQEERNINFWRFSAKLTLLLFHSQRDACAPSPWQRSTKKKYREQQKTLGRRQQRRLREHSLFSCAKRKQQRTEKSLRLQPVASSSVFDKRMAEWVFPR